MDSQIDGQVCSVDYPDVCTKTALFYAPCYQRAVRRSSAVSQPAFSPVQNFHESSQSALVMSEELVLNLHLLPFLISGAGCHTHGGKGWVSIPLDSRISLHASLLNGGRSFKDT